MMKKCKIAFPFYTSRTYFHFLILLLAFSFSKANCRPEEASVESSKENPPTSEKVYISGGATIFIAEGTIISGAELVHKDIKKTKTLKKKVEKPKFVKRTPTITKPVASTPPIAIISSNKPEHSWENNNFLYQPGSITYNTSFKSFVALEQNAFISITFLFLIILILIYQNDFTRTMLLQTNFQRPPPTIS